MNNNQTTDMAETNASLVKDGVKLTVKYPERVDSLNASGIEKELMDNISGIEEVILDFEDVEYISSAGIRTLVRLRQKMENVSIENAMPVAYEALDLTGITELMKVSRGLRKVPVDGLEKIGQGGTAAVYRLDDDKIVKVFITGFPFFMINAEKDLSRKLFLEGVPTAVPYEVVRCGEHIGVIYEMLKADSLDALLIREPENADYYIRLLADLQKKMMSTDVADLQPISGRMAAAIPMWAQAGLIEPSEIEKYQGIIYAIPERDTYVHGDFHLGNVMKSGDELILIDMAGSSKGHPVHDLSGMCTFLYTLSLVLEPEKYRAFTGLEPETGRKYWDMYLHAFFDGRDEDFIAKANMQTRVVSALRAVSSAAHIKDFVLAEKLKEIFAFINENRHFIEDGFDF